MSKLELLCCDNLLGVRKLAAIALPLLAPAACVIGRPARPSLNESAQGPTAQPVTGSPVLPSTTAPDAETRPAPDAGKPGSVWVRGYWHWDGVRYVWQRGSWQSSPGTLGQPSAPGPRGPSSAPGP